MTNLRSTKSHPIQIEWNLSCSQKVAIEIVQNSVGNPDSLMPDWGKVKGIVEGNKFRIWSSTPGMRGLTIVLGKGEIFNNNNSTHLTATIGYVWPFSLFNFSHTKIAFIAFVALMSWVLSLTGGIAKQYNILSDIFFPVGGMAIFLLVLKFIAYIGEDELFDLVNFLEKTFAGKKQITK